MKRIHKIFTSFLVLLTAVTFVISTTGFTSIKHFCTHHETVTVVIPDENSCCSAVENSSDSLMDDCCAGDHCGTEDNHSNCCTDEMSYHRLAELFISSDSENHLSCKSILILKKLNISALQKEFAGEIVVNQFSVADDAHPPLYILYQQAKLEPPLI